MKIVLQINGEDRVFCEQELTIILERYFSEEDTKRDEIVEYSQVPTEGKWFKVIPLAINQNLFKEERSDEKQEAARQLILEAFQEMKKDSKYEKAFRTTMPKKRWSIKQVKELMELAPKKGNHCADRFEQALEWAQRINNGESWESVCNKTDNANWLRIVDWKEGFVRLIGGSSAINSKHSATEIECERCLGYQYLDMAVPLIVSYE